MPSNDEPMSIGTFIDRTVPSEKAKTTLPNYTIEPPDVLIIDAIKVVPKPPYHIEATDVLSIEVIRIPV